MVDYRPKKPILQQIMSFSLYDIPLSFVDITAEAVWISVMYRPTCFTTLHQKFKATGCTIATWLTTAIQIGLTGMRQDVMGSGKFKMAAYKLVLAVGLYKDVDEIVDLIVLAVFSINKSQEFAKVTFRRYWNCAYRPIYTH